MTIEGGLRPTKIVCRLEAKGYCVRVYRLALPPEMERFHNVFHMSMLRRYCSYPSHVIPLEQIEGESTLQAESFASSLRPSSSHQSAATLSVSFILASNCAAGVAVAYHRTAAFVDDVVIVAACHTAICKAKRGGFKDTLADDLIASVLKALIHRTKLNPSEVSDIVVGTVLAPGLQRGIECMMAAYYAGFPDTVPIRTVNRQCSSGLQAVADVAAFIKAGYYDIGIGAGLESMTIDKVVPGVPKVNPKYHENKVCILLVRTFFYILLTSNCIIFYRQRPLSEPSICFCIPLTIPFVSLLQKICLNKLIHSGELQSVQEIMDFAWLISADFRSVVNNFDLPLPSQPVIIGKR
ncbi:uncharacterized protein LOC120172295 [Hibiscus syriacus]|uniref:uncharacterized protein LOC120172295 n=1 Tax=Hibiscus syriacus TaxID=106335 RepID=UPI001922C9B9|nr:uncharacterized protein LOC120172295 [Hibiscus syriacus]